MSLNIRNNYLCNSFRQQEESNLILGICFENYTSRINIYLKETQIERDETITCVMSLPTRNHYLCNSFKQQEESNLILGICFENYTSRINIYLKETQIECDEP